jgi:hypothetical protein
MFETNVASQSSDFASAIDQFRVLIDALDERLAKLERGQYAIRSNHNDLARRHASLDRVVDTLASRKRKGAS